MRSSLIAGLVANIKYNANRKQSRVRVFELGRVFRRDPAAQAGPLGIPGVSQPQHIAGAAWGPAVDEQWGVSARQVDFYDVKKDVETLLGARSDRLRCVAAPHPCLHPGRSARLELDGCAIGWLGELHPRWARQVDLVHAPVVFEIDMAAISRSDTVVASQYSRQPMVVRDLAVWVDAQVPFQAMSDTLAQTIASDDALAIVRDVRLFDIWRDAGKPDSPATAEKSMGFRFWLQSTETTLDDATVDNCMGRLADALAKEHGARQRT
jgi:phenylalanyl-tRNA synthetase beta chain